MCEIAKGWLWNSAYVNSKHEKNVCASLFELHVFCMLSHEHMNLLVRTNVAAGWEV